MQTKSSVEIIHNKGQKYTTPCKSNEGERERETERERESQKIRGRERAEAEIMRKEGINNNGSERVRQKGS